MIARLRWGLHAAGLWAVATSILAAPPAKKPVEFRFDPGDGRSWTETTQVTVKAWPRHKGDVPFKAERVDRLTARRSEQGWEIAIEPVSNRADEGARPTLDPVMGAFADRLRSVALDESGNVLSVRLADGPETEATRVRDLLGADSVERILGDAWRRRGAGLNGRTAARDANWSESVKIALPSGESVNYKTRWSVGQSVKCGDDECVRVFVQWTADLTPTFMAKERDVASRWAGDVVSPSGRERWYLKGKGQLVVEPDGLRVRSLRTEEKLSSQLAAAYRSDLRYGEIVETREMVASTEDDPQ